MDLPCLIVEVANLEAWARAPGGGRWIPAHRRAAVLQPNRATAEQEAQRLATRYPASLFLIFEASTLTKLHKVPTHVTLGGQVVADRWQARLVDLASEPDELPF